MARFSKVSISVDALDKVGGMQRFLTTSKSGGKYFNLTLVERKEIGKYGDTHFLKVSWKEGDKWHEQIVGSVTPQEEHHNPNSPKSESLPF